MRVEIHLCHVPGCPKPPAFLVGRENAPMCETHYKVHSMVEGAMLRARLARSEAAR